MMPVTFKTLSSLNCVELKPNVLYFWDNPQCKQYIIMKEIQYLGFILTALMSGARHGKTLSTT